MKCAVSALKSSANRVRAHTIIVPQLWHVYYDCGPGDGAKVYLPTKLGGGGGGRWGYNGTDPKIFAEAINKCPIFQEIVGIFSVCVPPVLYAPPPPPPQIQSTCHCIVNLYVKALTKRGGAQTEKIRLL